jgi:tRNA pseudouridine38-40 synthase
MFPISDEQPKRFRLLVEYDGTDFLGWQFQSTGRTVQGEMESALRRLFRTQIRMHGAGRTDSGVHASGQVAHFDLACRLDAGTMVKALNAELPADITVHDAEIVGRDFHSRFSASSRSYEYTIVHRRVSIDRRRQWSLYPAIDHDAVREAVGCLEGTHDFRAFAKVVPAMQHHYCHVFHVEWTSDGTLTHFHIKANRFLQGMVRCLVGSLVHVGRHRITPADFVSILRDRDRGRAPMLAPAQGLVLTHVAYDAGERELIHGIMASLQASREMEE